MKKIISLFLIGLIFCFGGINTQANYGVDFGDGEAAYDPEDALEIMYGEEYSWDPIEIKTIADVTNYQILDVQSSVFEEEIISVEMEKLGITTSYAGCGPIAMMGIVEYFSRVFPHLQIARDTTIDLHEIAM